MKKNIERILQKIMKKKLIGTSHAWSMRQLSYRPSDPAYYIEYCRISRYFLELVKELVATSWPSWICSQTVSVPEFLPTPVTTHFFKKERKKNQL